VKGTQVKMEKRIRWMAIALAGLMLIAVSPLAYSQSCALCYTQAASSGSRMIQALRSGILVLIVPPTLMWIVIMGILYSKRNQFKHADGTPESNSNWQ